MVQGTGEQLIGFSQGRASVWILLLFLVLLAIMVLDRYRATTAARGDAPRIAPARLRTIGTVLSVLSIVLAGISTYWIVRIGHTGAKASWDTTERRIQRSDGETVDRDG